jgi:hypothetical protein
MNIPSLLTPLYVDRLPLTRGWGESPRGFQSPTLFLFPTPNSNRYRAEVLGSKKHLSLKRHALYIIYCKMKNHTEGFLCITYEFMKKFILNALCMHLYLFLGQCDSQNRKCQVKVSFVH